MADLIEKELQSFSEPKEVDYYCVECFQLASYINWRLPDVFYCSLNHGFFLCRQWYFSVPTVYLSVTLRMLGIHTEIKWRSAFSWSFKSWKLEELVMSTLLLIRFLLIMNPLNLTFLASWVKWRFHILMLACILAFCYHTFFVGWIFRVVWVLYSGWNHIRMKFLLSLAKKV